MGRVRVWRITHKRYAKDAFSGEGARIYGGRFNSAGFPAVYTSGSLSLALLESLVQTNDKTWFSSCVFFYADIPDSLIKEVSVSQLPDGWDVLPCEAVSQRFGDQWILDQESAVLKVPSVVLPVEWNYVLNPQHPDFSNIHFSAEDDLPVDERLMI
jgi:RES domain-containing protein